MSAVPRFPNLGGYAGCRMTDEEFLSLSETAERYELVDGVVIMAPSPMGWHNEVALDIARQLGDYMDAHPGVRVFPEIDVRFSQGSRATVYRPDISVYAPGKITGPIDVLTTAPDLIIEVLSPGTATLDFITKRDDYERFQVREYLIVDPKSIRVRAWQLRASQMLEVPVDPSGYDSAVLPGFQLNIARLLKFGQG